MKQLNYSIDTMVFGREAVPNILVGVTGSVAAIKTQELVNLFQNEGFNVQIVVTEAARNFFEMPIGSVQIYTDKDEYKCWEKRGDDVLHIKLRDWADVYLIAPMSANTMAKIALGFADNLLTCIARAWYFPKPPTTEEFPKFGVFAPAMNTTMWNHPLTSKYATTLQETLLWKMIPPITKKLMCGEEGVGAMEEPINIVKLVGNEYRNRIQKSDTR